MRSRLNTLEAFSGKDLVMYHDRYGREITRKGMILACHVQN